MVFSLVRNGLISATILSGERAAVSAQLHVSTHTPASQPPLGWGKSIFIWIRTIKKRGEVVRSYGLVHDLVEVE